MRYIVVENTPGYLPDSEPATFNNFAEALQHADDLKNEIMDSLVDSDVEDAGIPQLYHVVMDRDENWAQFTISCNAPHSLDRVITVEEVELND